MAAFHTGHVCQSHPAVVIHPRDAHGLVHRPAGQPLALAVPVKREHLRMRFHVLLWPGPRECMHTGSGGTTVACSHTGMQAPPLHTSLPAPHMRTLRRCDRTTLYFQSFHVLLSPAPPAPMPPPARHGALPVAP